MNVAPEHRQLRAHQVQSAGEWVTFHAAQCACGKEESVRAPEDGAEAPSIRRLTDRGWRIGGVEIKCPACAAAHPARTPAAGKAHQPRADKPRDPTPADNRRISEALEAHYDVGRGLYLKSFSDQAVGRQLDVPPIWVTRLRQLMFGEGGGCEAELDRAAELPRLKRELAAKMDEVVTWFADFERRLAQLEPPAAETEAAP